MKKRIVLADPDPRSQRVLEVSLVQAGYAVVTADDGEAAWARIIEDVPDSVVADTRLPNLDGYGLVRKMRAKSEVCGVPVVFITQQRGVEDKIRGLELGVEEFLTKPVYAHELVARAAAIFSRITSRALAAAAPVNPDAMAGKLSEMGLFDLMLTFESARRSGAIRLASARGPATIWFRDGRVVDAECGSLRGPDAIYRAFVWTDGTFQIDANAIAKEETITDSADVIVTDATRRVKEWQRVTEQLPSLATIFEVDTATLLSRLPEIPDEINGILRLIDGSRSVWTLIDESPFDDLSTLSTLAKLYFEGLLKPKDDAKEVHAPTAPHGTLPPVVVTRIESVVPPASVATAPSTQASPAAAQTQERATRASDAAPPPSRTIVPLAVPPPQHPPPAGSTPPLVAGAHTTTAAFPVKEETKDYATVPKSGTKPPPPAIITTVSGSSEGSDDWATRTMVHGSGSSANRMVPELDEDDLEHRTLRMKNPVSDPAPVHTSSGAPAAVTSSPPLVKAPSVPPKNDEETTVASASNGEATETMLTPVATESIAGAMSDDKWTSAAKPTSSNPPNESRPAAASVEPRSESKDASEATLESPRGSLRPQHWEETLSPPPVRRVQGKFVVVPLVAIMVVVAAVSLIGRTKVRGEHDSAEGLSMGEHSITSTATAPAETSTMGAGVVPTTTVTPPASDTALAASAAPTQTALAATQATTATAAPPVRATAAPPTSATTATTATAPATAATAAAINESNPVAAAQQYLEKGNPRKAVELAERATRSNPSDAEAWLTLGAAYQLMGAGGRARAAYQRCAESGAGGRVSECKALLGNE